MNTTTAKDSDRIAAGAFLVMVYGRLRFSDMQRSSGFTIDSVVHEGVKVGYLEARAERTKTSISLERKVRALPVAIPLKCVGPRPWVRVWMNLRVSQGLDDSFPVLPNPAAGGGWSKVPLKVDRGGAWLRALLPGSSEAASDVRIATHSCKATALSWLAKRGIAAGPRRTLGYHIPRKDKSLIIYSRDSLAAPLRDLDRTLAEISTGTFKPDATRSGMIANFEDPGDPSGETEVDAISSSSSEASDDEEEAPQSEEEAALDHMCQLSLQKLPAPIFPNYYLGKTKQYIGAIQYTFIWHIKKRKTRHASFSRPSVFTAKLAVQRLCEEGGHLQCNAYTAKLKMHFAPSFMPPGVGGWDNEIFTCDYLGAARLPTKRMITHPIKKVIGAISQKFR